MKCVNHPGTEAESLCVMCQAPVCGECAVELNGKHYCRRCLETRVAAEVHTGPGGVNIRRSSFSVLVLSLIPGGGYMYLGLMNRGLQAMILFFGTIFLASVVNLGALVGLVIPVLMFYSIFDSLQLASRMNDGLFIEDRPYLDIGNPNWQNILGYTLIGLGALALFYNVLNGLPSWSSAWGLSWSISTSAARIFDRLLPPLVIIAIGAYILFRNLRRKPEKGDVDDTAQQG
jgi:hypothetical protein